MEYKYKLSLCICIKNEEKYIEDFIMHYVKQGVDHFYIVNNNSSDNTAKIIEKSNYIDLITLVEDKTNMDVFDIKTSIGPAQILSNNFYELIKKETEWALFVDIDEYMFGRNGHSLKTFLSTIDENVGCIYVIWNIINPNLKKKETYNEFLISNNFSTKYNIKRLNNDFKKKLPKDVKETNDFGKSLFRTSMLRDETKISLHKAIVTGKIINNYGENKNAWWDNGNAIDYSEENFAKVNISLNHYVIRDFDDFIKKKQNIYTCSPLRKIFLCGIFEMLNLDESFFIEDNSVNEYEFEY